MNVVPFPNSIKYADGFVGNPDNIDSFKVKDESLGDEGYIIIADNDGIKLTAQTDAGLFYASETLEQLKAGGMIPCVTIKDKPRFAYRGFMLDSARHMQSLDEIKRLIDAAAMLKLNRMHWHLSDDQGFRIESKKFPLLNEKGSWRESDDFGGTHIEKRYGGYYTHEEIKEIVSYCKERFIEVVPEIDMPGHTTAIVSSYPELSCRKVQVPVQTKQGIFEDVLCVGDEKTLEFVYELLDEIIPLFPCEYFHIGGDEVKYTYWKSCLKCREKLSELVTVDYAALQGWFTGRIIEHLKTHGKKPIVWNESLAGDNLPADTVAQMWMDPKKHSVRWANRANKVITSDFYHYYCDYPYFMTPVKKTYSFNPVLKGIAPVMEKFVMGVEAPIWTEYICDFEKLCYMYFPRLAAVAENGWTKKEKLDYAGFESRFIEFIPMLEKIGVNPAPVSEWNPNLLERLSGTLDFFKDKISVQALKDGLNANKK